MGIRARSSTTRCSALPRFLGAGAREPLGLVGAVRFGGGRALQPLESRDLHNLADNIARQGLVVDQILPLHGRVVPAAELYRTIGRNP